MCPPLRRNSKTRCEQETRARVPQVTWWYTCNTPLSRDLRGKPSVDLLARVEVSGREPGRSLWHRLGLRRRSLWQQEREFLNASPVVLRNNMLLSPWPRVRAGVVLKRPRIDQCKRDVVLHGLGGIALQPSHVVIVSHGRGLREPAQFEHVPGVVVDHDAKLVLIQLCLHVSPVLSSTERWSTSVDLTALCTSGLKRPERCRPSEGVVLALRLD